MAQAEIVQEAPASSRVDHAPRTAVADGDLSAQAVGAYASPWPLFRIHARSIALGIATCLAILITIELALFRSGLFISHASVSTPDFLLAKLALAARQPDTRVLFVGDSTMLTGVAPATVSAGCECGPAFNGAAAAANPWVTAAMTRRFLTVQQPDLVVVGVSPWTIENELVFSDSELGHGILSPADFAAVGAPLDPAAAIDAWLGTVLSAYGQRMLIKEWLSSLLPRQRYDETRRGFYVWPGSATSPSQLAAGVARMKANHKGVPTATSAGARVTRSLIADLRARGIAVAVLVPPFHPAAYEAAGEFLDRSVAAVRELAQQDAVPVIDCRAMMTAADFRDFDHLGESGAVKHSACIGDQIRTLSAH